MSALVDGLAALLDQLSIEKVILFAASFGGDVGQCFVRRYPQRVSKLILLNTGLPDERIGRATKRMRPLVTLLPLGMTRSLVQQYLGKALSVRPEERLFWRAVLHELVANLTREDLVSSFDETVDYRLNYHFSPSDLTTWPGKILILQSDDDPATTEERRMALSNMYPQATGPHLSPCRSYAFPDPARRVLSPRSGIFTSAVREYFRPEISASKTESWMPRFGCADPNNQYQ